MKSSGTLRSRFPSAPSSPLTNSKIKAYILAGRYGPVMQAKEAAKEKTKTKKPKPPSTLRLHKNSLALRDLNHLL